MSDISHWFSQKNWRVTSKTWMIMFWETNTWRHSLNTSRSESLDCFVKIILVQCGYWSYGIQFAGVFFQVHFMDSLSPSLLNPWSRHYYFWLFIPRWLYQFALLNCKVHMAGLSNPCCQVHIGGLPTPLCQVHIPKTASRYCSTLPSRQVHTAKTTLANCHVHFTMRIAWMGGCYSGCCKVLGCRGGV
jgi:hypothetical protein